MSFIFEFKWTHTQWDFWRCLFNCRFALLYNIPNVSVLILNVHPVHISPRRFLFVINMQSVWIVVVCRVGKFVLGQAIVWIDVPNRWRTQSFGVYRCRFVDVCPQMLSELGENGVGCGNLIFICFKGVCKASCREHIMCDCIVSFEPIMIVTNGSAKNGNGKC